MVKWFWTSNRGDGPNSSAVDPSPIVRIWDAPLEEVDYFMIDIETSGFSAERDTILSLAAGCTTGKSVEFTKFMYDVVRHDHVDHVPQVVWDLTGLTPEQLRTGSELAEVLREALTLAVNRVWVAHHARHEVSFLQRYTRQIWKLKLRPLVIDTATVAQALGRLSRVPTLDEVCAWLGVDVTDRHRADADVRMTAQIWLKEMEMCQAIGLRTVSDVIDWTSARAFG
ncbi:exonuclease domain-containing protein [Alicyclobacillus acidiphilus]|uniref:exonuclease domain-containing protein n=1 Tax=Alicyclobacillus acidiphilus TaxID=182455 RepID=UPI000B058044|nr:exonuclease domain-containing protein [Alicyclobacillus acidiphilus]